MARKKNDYFENYQSKEKINNYKVKNLENLIIQRKNDRILIKEIV